MKNKFNPRNAAYLIMINTLFVPLCIYIFVNFKTALNYFIVGSIGIPYAILSFVAFWSYNKFIQAELVYEQFKVKPQFSNIDQDNLWSERMQKSLEKYLSFREYFHDSSRYLYFLQGFIAIGGLVIFIVDKFNK